MRTSRIVMLVALVIMAGVGAGCDGSDSMPAAGGGEPPQHASNIPPLDPTNIVRIASDSPDHTTLVAAIQAADYVTSVAASGPLTVFAPTNAAFDALPAGTLDTLLEPENRDQLREILKYHVTTSSLRTDGFRDGQKLGMANGAKTVLHVEDDVIEINGARIVASIPASNGMIHVVDAVLLPPDES